MRVFIAIELEEEVKEKLAEIQSKVKVTAEKGRFTAVSNFHLTLYFIGEADSERIGQISKAIDKCAEHNVPFKLSLGKLGSFNKRSKRIIWVGVDGDIRELKKVNEQISAELNEEEHTDEKGEYTPHITLGRQIVFNQDFEEWSQSQSAPPVAIEVDKISLMESTRLNGELIYRPIYVKPVRKDITE